MATIFYTNKQQYPFIENYLKISKQDYIKTVTSGAIIIKENGVNHVFSDKKLSQRIFNLLSRIKSELNKNEKLILNSNYSKNPYKIDYLKFSDSLENYKNHSGLVQTFLNVVEADITGAYYKAALNLGFITLKTYKDCMALPKHYRLMCLGMIATKKTIEIYKAGNLISEEIKVNELHRKAWFIICSYVDNCMKTLVHTFNELDKNIFLFYWVDGIYFRFFEAYQTNYFFNQIFDELKTVFNFDWKFTFLEKIEVENRNTHAVLKVYKPGADKPKVFTKPNKKMVYYGLYSENNFNEVENINIDLKKFIKDL